MDFRRAETDIGIEGLLIKVIQRNVLVEFLHMSTECPPLLDSIKRPLMIQLTIKDESIEIVEEIDRAILLWRVRLFCCTTDNFCKLLLDLLLG